MTANFILIIIVIGLSLAVLLRIGVLFVSFIIFVGATLPAVLRRDRDALQAALWAESGRVSYGFGAFAAAALIGIVIAVLFHLELHFEFRPLATEPVQFHILKWMEWLPAISIAFFLAVEALLLTFLHRAGNCVCHARARARYFLFVACVVSFSFVGLLAHALGPPSAPAALLPENAR